MKLLLVFTHATSTVLDDRIPVLKYAAVYSFRLLDGAGSICFSLRILTLSEEPAAALSFVDVAGLTTSLGL